MIDHSVIKKSVIFISTKSAKRMYKLTKINTRYKKEPTQFGWFSVLGIIPISYNNRSASKKNY